MDRFNYDGSTGSNPVGRVRCRSCGETVTPRFARVFGDNEDVIHACLMCTTGRELISGFAARRE